MNFMKSSSNGISKKSKGKGFGIELSSVIMGLERIQHPPRQQHQKCYLTICSLGKSQPKQQVCDTTRNTYHFHLNRCPPHFSEGQVQQKGGFLGDPRGICKGGSKEQEEHHYRSRSR